MAVSVERRIDRGGHAGDVESLFEEAAEGFGSLKRIADGIAMIDNQKPRFGAL